MLRGDRVLLRARQESDIPIFHAEFHDDVELWAQTSPRPWQPIPAGSPASPYAVREPTDGSAAFSVVDLATEELAGSAVLWGIDAYNRSAHIGVSLRTAFRGRGLGTDVVRVLCHFAFAVRGLHRLQVETLATNTSMISSAERVGFVREGTLRHSGWVNGGFADEAILGLLDDDWRASARG